MVSVMITLFYSQLLIYFLSRNRHIWVATCMGEKEKRRKRGWGGKVQGNVSDSNILFMGFVSLQLYIGTIISSLEMAVYSLSSLVVYVAYIKKKLPL